jgi:glycosyltransferase involved in cell wall biosynthesis
VHPEPGEQPYRFVPDARFEFRELPYYASLYSPGGLLRSAALGLRSAWKAVGDSDAAMLGVPIPWSLLLWLMSALRGRPVIFLVRQDALARVRLRASGLKRALSMLAVGTIERMFILLARRTLTFTVGEAMARRYGRPGAPVYSVLTSLLPASDLEQARPRPAPPADAPRSLLWVGRLDPDKGLEFLLEAFRLLCAGAPDTLSLHLVGDGSAAGGFKERVRQMGLESSVQFHAYVPFGPQLRALYERATVFVLPSNESEGFPKVIMEAMATGLPVVATAGAGIPFLVKDGVHALLVPPRDPSALAEAVERVLSDEDLYHRLSVAGLDLARQHTLEAQREKMLERIVPYLAARWKRA